MSSFNDYNTNNMGGGNNDQKYETPYQTGT